ncbi:MAG: hypothetical protein ACRYF4_06355 [Janthinobacterium lividum]
MNDRYEDRIETVVKAMQHAEPSAGMEQRILARLRVAEVPQAKRKWWTLPLPRYAMTAAVIAAAAGLFVQHQAGKKDMNGAPALAHGSMPAAENTVKQIAFPGDVAAHPVKVASTPNPFARLNLVHSVVHKTSVAGQPVIRSEEDDRNLPAPSLPLTEQERLLLRFVKHEPSTQLAELSASAQDAIFQREKEHVAEYFAKPLPAVDPAYDAGQQ